MSHCRLKFLAGTLCAVALSAFGPAASAAVTIFDVSGDLRNGSMLTGTLSIDTASGVQHPLTALNLTFTAGNNQFAGFTTNTILSASTFQGYYQIEAGAYAAPYARLLLHTSTLAGFTGGPLCSDFNVAPANCGFSSVAYAANGAYSAVANGAVTQRDVQGAVPEPATWAMMLVGFGGLGAVIRRRRSVLAARPQHT